MTENIETYNNCTSTISHSDHFVVREDMGSETAARATDENEFTNKTEIKTSYIANFERFQCQILMKT